jgi:hypothetical protein
MEFSLAASIIVVHLFLEEQSFAYLEEHRLELPLLFERGSWGNSSRILV